ncbi:MAG TPA: hypothetical protein VLD67_05105 [Vicinamibacterales bacterium]|nr:hypothetical protein [Vicinamibacterales bacterium]
MLPTTIPLAALALIAAFHPAAAGAASGARSCDLSPPEARWIQRALDGWDLVRRDYLKLDPAPLPWIVLFDASCIWHVAPTDPRVLTGAEQIGTALTFADGPVDVRALPHDGTVLLPSRYEIPVDVKASTALYRGGRATFLAMSMPALWRASRAHGRNPHLDDYLQGVFVHELTHTRHLVPLNRRLRRLAEDADLLLPVNDDVVQGHFRKEPGFSRAMETERDMYFRAAAEPDPGKRLQLASAALSLRRERHARYFSGANSAFADIETVFLTLEGTGQWSAYKLTVARGPYDGAAALKLVRDNRRFWSQDVGLGVFLLLNTLVPDWQAKVFAAEPASPFDLLEAALPNGTGDQEVRRN